MINNVEYTDSHRYKITGDILYRLQSLLCLKKNYGMTSQENEGELTLVNFYFEDIINRELKKILICFTISIEAIEKTHITIYNQEDESNEYDLKNYLRDLYFSIMMDEHNKEKEKFTIRTYSKIYNSHPIDGEYLVYFGSRILIKPLKWTSKEEPLTEQIIMYDIEVDAVDILQARSIAYNLTYDLNALLSVLLEVGFEMINSEFRTFIFKNENEKELKKQFTLNRYRTGFYDSELGIIVKDNLNGLKSIYDLEDVNSFNSGKIVMSFNLDEFENNQGINNSTYIFDATDKSNLTKVFKNHKIKKGDTQPNYDEEIITRQRYLNEKILIPRSIRKYLKTIHQLDNNKKDIFLRFSRLYNISLVCGSKEPTLLVAYKICSIEALAEIVNMKYSPFMVKYNDENFDKKLSDYFYKTRSSHFHSGKQHFNESNMSFLLEFDNILQEKNKELYELNKFIRIAIVNFLTEDLKIINNEPL